MVKIHTPPEVFTSLQTALAERYVLEREIGHGGMATVYLARDLRSDRRVAVKVLLPEFAASVSGERFVREIELGSRFRHPNILGVLDSGTANGQPFYVMPFIDGESLRDRLDRERQVPIEDAMEIACAVADALTYAHAKGVIHRDIKPENILLDRNVAEGDARSYHVWLADFGIAHAAGVAGGERLTQSGMAVGTPAYMSPEQAAGSFHVTPQSDIYSLACVIYEMLAGEPPFSGPTAPAIFARHSLESVPSIRIVRSALPEHVEFALCRALEKVPADRFATADDFAKALTGEVPAAPCAHVRPRTADRAAQQAPQGAPRRMRLAVIAALALVVAGSGGWFAWRRMDRAAAEGRFGTDSDPRHIAVLYFDDRSPGGELRHLADGLTEALILELSDVKPLSVISRNGVSQFRGKDVPPDSVGRALRVGTLVSGSIAADGDRLRLNVSLVDAPTGRVLGSRTLDQPRGNLLALQDSLAQDVALVLRRRLGEEIEVLAGQAGTRSAEAWDRFQRARRTLADAEALVGEAGVEAALPQFAAADSQLARVEPLDARWPAPIVQRGWIAYRRARLTPVGDPSHARSLDAGLAHAERALALAPNDADALELRATIRYWRWVTNQAPDPAASRALLAAAEADFTASTDANPLQASAWNSLSHLRMATSQTSQGQRAALRAYEADPYLTNVDQTIWRLFLSSLDLDAAVEARKWCAEGARRFPDNFRFTECRLWLATMRGETPTPADLWRTYDEFVRRSPENLRPFHALKGGMLASIALAHGGLPDSARAVIARSRGDASVDPGGELPYLEAIARAQLGDRDEAIRLLSRYLAANPRAREFAGHDESWWFDDIRDDPRYRALVGPSS